MIRQIARGALAAVPLLLAAAPAYAQTAPVPTPAMNCQFQLGFATIAGMIPNAVGGCIDNQKTSNDQGDTMQETTNGLLTWTKSTGITEFTDGSKTWVDGPYGLVLRAADTAYPWEGTTSIVAGIAINKDGQPVDPATGKVLPTDARTKAS